MVAGVEYRDDSFGAHAFFLCGAVNTWNGKDPDELLLVFLFDSLLFAVLHACIYIVFWAVELQ